MIVYEGIGPEKDTVVGEDVAFAYAMERLKNADEEEKKEFVKWYFSGNWIEKEEDERSSKHLRRTGRSAAQYHNRNGIHASDAGGSGADRDGKKISPQ